MEKYAKYVLGILMLVLVFVGVIGQEVEAVDVDYAYYGCNGKTVEYKDGTETQTCYYCTDSDYIDKNIGAHVNHTIQCKDCKDPKHIDKETGKHIAHDKLFTKYSEYWECTSWKRDGNEQYYWFTYGDLVQANSNSKYFCFKAGGSMRSQGNAEGWLKIFRDGDHTSSHTHGDIGGTFHHRYNHHWSMKATPISFNRC